jgi:hypothetical protein
MTGSYWIKMMGRREQNADKLPNEVDERKQEI